MKVMGQDRAGAFVDCERSKGVQLCATELAKAVAQATGQAANAAFLTSGHNPKVGVTERSDDAPPEAHRRAPLRNFLSASAGQAASLLMNAASIFKGGRTPDGVVSPDLKPVEARAHLKAAELASDVYNDSGAPEGFTRVDDTDLKKLGLDPAEFRHQKSGLDAALYRDDESGKLSLVFRGSESSSLHDIRKDWAESNATQALGALPASYRQGAALAAKVTQALGEDVHLVGHSLGGGIANYAAVKNNLDFTVFNAAGLSRPVEKSLSKQLAEYTGEGVVINDKYDPLTNLGGQDIDETFGGKHVGYDKLIFVDNDQFNRALSLLNPGLRIAAHGVDGNISDYLRSESAVPLSQP